MKEISITKCSFCGGTEFITAFQGGNGAVYSTDNSFRGTPLYHTICRDCGSVVRSYVTDPEKLLKKSDRRQEGE